MKNKHIITFIETFFNEQRLKQINSYIVYSNDCKPITLFKQKNKTVYVSTGTIFRELIYFVYAIKEKNKSEIKKELIFDLYRFEESSNMQKQISYDFVKLIFMRFGREFCFMEMTKHLLMDI